MDPVPEIRKATRKRLTIAQKLDIADLLEKGHCTEAIERQYGIAGRTVRNIRATAPQLLRVANKKPKSMQLKTRQAVWVPNLEAKLLEFLNYARSAEMPVSQNVPQTRARMIPDHMLKASATEKERSIIQKFTASCGWVEKFVKRNALRSVSLHGEGGQVHAQNVAKDINILSYLRSAKRAFLTAKHDRDPKRSRQTLIAECMK